MSDRRVLPRLLAVVGFCMLGSCASPPSEMASAESQEDSTRIWDAPESLLVAESPIAPALDIAVELFDPCLLYTSPSPRDRG